MSDLDALGSVLALPAELPLALRGCTLELTYTPGAAAGEVPSERLAELREALGELERLLAAGFLSEPAGAGPQDAALAARLSAPDRLTLTFHGAPRSLGLLALLLRLVQLLHDTPAEALAELVRALGSEQAALEAFGGVRWREVAARLELRECLAGPGPWAPARTALAPFLGQGPWLEQDQVVLQDLPEGYALDEALAASYLSLATLGITQPLGARARHDPGDEELLTRPGREGGVELVVQNVAGERWVVEALLSCLAPGARLPGR